LRAEKILSFPATPNLPDVARFDFFRKGDRPAGAWLVRQGRMRFALPITTGVRPGIADYLPAPHGLAGFAAPVEQVVPALTPYLELEDGRVIVAGDGADEIVPAADGNSLRLVWKRWALVNLDNKPENDLPFGEPEKFVEPGLTAEVSWTLRNGNTLVRMETITADLPVPVRRLWLTFPGTGDKVAEKFTGMGETPARIFTGRDGALEFYFWTSHPSAFRDSVQAAGNSALGKGTRGHIPLLLNLEATNLTITPGAPLRLDISLKLFSEP
jgi:hypothetical protein